MELPEDFLPTDTLLKVLQIVMTENFFEFDDTFWKQVVDTAMGTSCACNYATVTYGYHERQVLLPTYRVLTKGFIRRFIDDMFGIWYDPEMPLNLTEKEEKCWFENNTAWNKFKSDLPSLGLEWVVDVPKREQDFLDLTLSIRNGEVHSRTYQKWMNLYLYIPPHSAHPSSCLKGLIFGILIRYWQQNTDTKDFVDLAGKFYNRLLARGHAEETIAPLFRSAASHIDWRDENPDLVKEKKISKKMRRKDTLYIPWRSHPAGLTNKGIRKLYEDHLEGHTLKAHVVISQSRPRNLRDLLMSNTYVCVGDSELVSEQFKRYREARS